MIGLYEDAFSENLSAVKRQKLLEQFTIWALLKKEVSANFVAEVLGEKEENVLVLNDERIASFYLKEFEKLWTRTITY